MKQITPEPVPARRGQMQHPQNHKQETHKKDRAPDQTPLFGPDRERKIGPVFGQKLELVLGAFQIAFSKPPA